MVVDRDSKLVRAGTERDMLGARAATHMNHRIIEFDPSEQSDLLQGA